MVVLNKPSGLLSVPGRGPDKQDCLSSRVQKQYDDALVVHRLDMATSGLIVMGRGLAMQRALNDAFAKRAVHKRYVAVVWGHPNAGEDALLTIDAREPPWQMIDLPIMVDWPNRPLRKIDMQHGQPSQTRWRCVNAPQTGGTARVELEPITGRSHQLRVHLQAIGHPILGDALYAPPDVLAMSPRLLLHSCALGFLHPIHGLPVQVECAAPF
jgi:tRNA pseudouridine32 synthase/23S rRNA pseudouridine746 synthase